ncbi:leucyl/phenylalanyl-tRNA--protein transferase [Acidomonas methanolica]|uniref:Leucyl/phenylalanyl-tRNA--protein transferase n=1 Tax=Acidomonas methanolica NBRC 104435 TaxID=1231351 RepID=A0A023D4V2_ACIMT|nr:leucyl/phenylalanyl-tRNA--protein transferase [Acidomonas methanolica]MBU2654868.1 leucyl/phenylalanyl-tRNA--protein transferase [Acidomonas methanolica]TCS24771.1 leucyl/phenylalanyl-tRNA--protein transferase [Acidomonas methanolica]GAJ29162.1 leucyl/phenylalanyl-tRNA--protein transferase [Acidomonas methanolica NBRC 104435]GBQ60451.1 leucyl/phenylalanyl-tRNA--protein transferase [Acidomonas methanolica]GEK99849.1 leucyl/phenylalanyl-tRNA--protein transferase [Acidomonas methanolica NBRC 1
MDVTPDMLLRGYAMGVFPMAPDRESDELEWYRPLKRGILPLDGFHLPRRLARVVSGGAFAVTSDRDFESVLEACADPAPGRETTWISGRIQGLYTALHRMGHAHSVECRQGGRLVGGLYGVTLGGAFFGESMFSRVTDASKVALVHLVAALRRDGFTLLDTQYATTHLERFGCVEIPASVYEGLLERALGRIVGWNPEVGLDALRGEIRAMAARGGG